MDVKQIRLENLNQLAAGPAYKRLGDFCEAVGISPSYLSQLRSAEHTKTVGNVVARRIETSLGLAHGWLDQPHDEVEQDGTPRSPTTSREDLAVLLTYQSLPEAVKIHIKAMIFSLAAASAAAVVVGSHAG